MKRLNTNVIIISLVVIAALIVAGLALMATARQPETADYKSLDLQRQVVDTSMNIYSPLFDEYSTGYNNVFAEERSSDDKSALKAQYVDSLEQERKVNADRLMTMESSIALRDPAVKTAFENFNGKYGAIISYYDQHTKNIANITESVGGPCALLSKLNVSVEDYYASYNKAADNCLSALATAKKTSDGTTKELLSDVEKLIKERRDKFKKVTEGKDDFEQNIARIYALISLLDINSDLKVIREKYEVTTKTEYTKLVNEANDANSAFDKALDKYLATNTATESKA